jgi:hypothetical protein
MMVQDMKLIFIEWFFFIKDINNKYYKNHLLSHFQPIQNIRYVQKYICICYIHLHISDISLFYFMPDKNFDSLIFRHT